METNNVYMPNVTSESMELTHQLEVDHNLVPLSILIIDLKAFCKFKPLHLNSKLLLKFRNPCPYVFLGCVIA